MVAEQHINNISNNQSNKKNIVGKISHGKQMSAGDDTVHLYLAEMGEIPLLTLKHERGLGKA
jgi:hypothetical protein